MAKRTVDKRKTARALRKLRNAAERATAEAGPGLTAWEKDFVEGVSSRLETYGSAFRDPGKGRLEEALSQRQAQVVRVIDKKARQPKAGKDTDGKKSPPKQDGLKRSSFKRKTPMGGAWKPRVRDINEDSAPPPRPDATPERKRAALRLVRGGKSAGRKG